jgi:hypothetical protein
MAAENWLPGAGAKGMPLGAHWAIAGIPSPVSEQPAKSRAATATLREDMKAILKASAPEATKLGRPDHPLSGTCGGPHFSLDRGRAGDILPLSSH